MCFCLRTTQKAGANLRSARAQDQCRSDAPLVSDSARRDNGNAHCVDHRRQQSKKTNHFALRTSGVKTSAMATRLHALRNNDIGAGGLRRAGLAPGFSDR